MSRSTIFLKLATALILGACLGNASAQTESACSGAGLTILTDAEGDWTGTVTSLSGNNGAGAPEQDLLQLSVAQPGGGDTLEFRLQTQPFTAPVPPPNAAWYSSFETPDGVVYGVRMQSDQTGSVKFFSYVAAPANGGQIDGRFVAAGSERPALEGSGFTADGLITIIVKAGSVGIIEAGQTLGPFNAATVQQAAIAGLTIDEMPDGLGRDGFFDIQESGCESKSGILGVGSLPFALLMPLVLAICLRRSRRGITAA